MKAEPAERAKAFSDALAAAGVQHDTLDDAYRIRLVCDGYVVIPGLLTSHELTALRAAFERPRPDHEELARHARR